jgi:hypothetical protein
MNKIWYMFVVSEYEMAHGQLMQNDPCVALLGS